MVVGHNLLCFHQRFFHVELGDPKPLVVMKVILPHSGVNDEKSKGALVFTLL